jgi:CubicO group peptidase (beta-lactamase class C family)
VFVPTPRMALVWTLLAGGAFTTGSAFAQGPPRIGFQFETYLEALRQQAGIPGLSAAVVQDGELAWAAGFGRQDLENNIPASPDTPYQIGGITQSVAATLLLRCVEEGRLDLNTPIHHYDARVADPGATVAHVLSHTSEGAPGSRFKYDPPRFAALTPVIAACADRPIQEVLAVDILERLAMRDSVPGQDVLTSARSEEDSSVFDAEARERYADVLQRLATPYRVDRNGRATVSEYPSRTIDASNGLITTVRDLARFDAALDDGILLRPETLTLAWTRPSSPLGVRLPHGLGWFSQVHEGELIVWQFGEIPGASSSLIMKLPRRRVTLILLANSDGLTAPFPLAAGDVTVSLFAKLFLRVVN